MIFELEKWAKGKRRTKSHIETNHNKNPLQCRVCTLHFRNIKDLATHIHITHNKIESKCKQCQVISSSEKELKIHIIQNHKTNKPCTQFKLNLCQYEEDCSFSHIILQEGEKIC